MVIHLLILCSSFVVAVMANLDVASAAQFKFPVVSLDEFLTSCPFAMDYVHALCTDSTFSKIETRSTCQRRCGKFISPEDDDYACSCDPNCAIYDDCCPDVKEVCSSESLNLLLIPSKHRHLLMAGSECTGSFRVISHCDASSSTDQEYDVLLKEAGLSHTVQMNTVITDQANGIHYQNISSYLCHNPVVTLENLKHLLPWSKQFYTENLTEPSEIIEFMMSGSVSNRFLESAFDIPPEGIETPRACRSGALVYCQQNPYFCPVSFSTTSLQSSCDPALNKTTAAPKVRLSDLCNVQYITKRPPTNVAQFVTTLKISGSLVEVDQNVFGNNMNGLESWHIENISCLKMLDGKCSVQISCKPYAIQYANTCLVPKSLNVSMVFKKRDSNRTNEEESSKEDFIIHELTGSNTKTTDRPFVGNNIVNFTENPTVTRSTTPQKTRNKIIVLLNRNIRSTDFSNKIVVNRIGNFAQNNESNNASSSLKDNIQTDDRTDINDIDRSRAEVSEKLNSSMFNSTTSKEGAFKEGIQKRTIDVPTPKDTKNVKMSKQISDSTAGKPFEWPKVNEANDVLAFRYKVEQLIQPLLGSDSLGLKNDSRKETVFENSSEWKIELQWEIASLNISASTHKIPHSQVLLSALKSQFVIQDWPKVSVCVTFRPDATLTNVGGSDLQTCEDIVEEVGDIISSEGVNDDGSSADSTTSVGTNEVPEHKEIDNRPLTINRPFNPGIFKEIDEPFTALSSTKTPEDNDKFDDELSISTVGETTPASTNTLTDCSTENEPETESCRQNTFNDTCGRVPGLIAVLGALVAVEILVLVG